MLNRTMIIGRLGADPEMRYTANGHAVTDFRVAVNHGYTSSNGERQEGTEWFRVVTWKRLAESCSQYLMKGRLVYVEGRLQTRSWEGKDGVRRYTTELVAQQVQFLDRPQEPPAGEAQAPQPRAAERAAAQPPAQGAAAAVGTAAGGDELFDDLPF